MSGRVLVTLSDGRTVRGFRKTLARRQPKRPLLDRLYELNERRARQTPTRWCPEVRVGFLLPKDLCAFVSSGPHPGGVDVHRGFVQITHGSADQCFERACGFLAAVARERPPFTIVASIISTATPGRGYGRHLTAVRGCLIVSGGVLDPRIYEARAA